MSDDSNKNNELIKDEVLKINKEIVETVQKYGKLLTYMQADAPIQVLCLSKPIETILLNNGCLRVYDLLDLEFAKIKGLGDLRIRELTTRLNQFISVS